MINYSAEVVLINNYTVNAILQNNFKSESVQLMTVIDMTQEIVKEMITAFAGGGQENATVISAKLNKVDTVVTDGDSIKCDEAIKGRIREISNASDLSLILFPAVGEQFESDALVMDVNESLTIDAGNTIRLVCYSNGKWRF